MIFQSCFKICFFHLCFLKIHKILLKYSFKNHSSISHRSMGAQIRVFKTHSIENANLFMTYIFRTSFMVLKRVRAHVSIMYPCLHFWCARARFSNIWHIIFRNTWFARTARACIHCRWKWYARARFCHFFSYFFAKKMRKHKNAHMYPCLWFLVCESAFLTCRSHLFQ